MVKMMGFSAQKASQVTGLTEARIRYWAETGIQQPSLVYEAGTRHGSLYSFRDLVSLRTLMQLRDQHGFSLQNLRAIGVWLREHHREPRATRRFFVYGDQLVFSDDEMRLISASKRGQELLKEINVDLQSVHDELQQRALCLRERDSEDVGQVTRTRLVFQRQPVIAGTRIPTATIWNYHKDGLQPQEILEYFPFLSIEDVQAALEFETHEREARKTA